MWEEIRLRRLGVIEDASLVLDPGLTVITGETGAGKTMLVTALGLLRGERADPSLVRHGAETARVEGRVAVVGVGGVADLVEASGGEVEDGTVIVARTLSPSGRSRAHLGGASVPASVLTDLGERLVAVHGQADGVRLRRPATQRDALDRFAGGAVHDLLARYRPAHRRLGQLRAELTRLQRESGEREREIDLLRLGLEEIGATAPLAGEDEALRREEDRLANAEALVLAATSARDALAGDDENAGATADVLGLLARAGAALEGARDLDPAVAALSSRLTELTYAVSEIATDLGGYAAGVEVDPLRLAAVQERRAALGTLARRYGPGLDGVLRWAEESAQRLVDLEQAADSVVSLTSQAADLHAVVNELAESLTAARRGAATDLGNRVTDELADLAMPTAQLTVRVGPSGGGPLAERLGPDGADEVELLVATAAGTAPRPIGGRVSGGLGSGVSGGELSRLMLALEVVLAGTTPVPTLVFDEVDAGVAGRAAVEVGRRLARLARHAQVLAVTHLPQVAAFADRHYQVEKSSDGSVTTSGVHYLDGAGRVRELSRMLAGLDGSATAAAHAEELLQLARRERKG